MPQPIIPVGPQSASWYFSPAHKLYVYLLADVPGHSGVEIHIGNKVQDTDGCMLIGEGYGLSDAHGTTDPGIFGSHAAFQTLINKVGTSEPWTFTIQEA